MPTKTNDLGIIEISEYAIAGLVSQAAKRTYGVVGMAEPSRASHLAATLTRDPHRGVGVQIADDKTLVIDVYIIVNYGINIASVANSLINAVRYHVEDHTGLSVKQVNIHIQGIRMTSPNQKL
jgi:uncharacterized alkaline shock family protein YloU